MTNFIYSAIRTNRDVLHYCTSNDVNGRERTIKLVWNRKLGLVTNKLFIKLLFLVHKYVQLFNK